MPPKRKPGAGGGGGARGGGGGATAAASPALNAAGDEQKLLNLIAQNNYSQVAHLVNMKMWTYKTHKDLLGKALVAALHARGTYKITQFLVNDLGVNVLVTYEEDAGSGQAVQPLTKALDVQDCKTVIAMLRSLEGHVAAAGGLAQMRVKGEVEGPLLGHAVRRGLVDTVKFIIEKDPEGSLQLVATSSRVENVLFLATCFGQKEVLACMARALGKQAGYNEAVAQFKYVMGHSLVYFAVFAGKLECLQWLISDTGGGLQRDLHFPAGSDNLPLHEAAAVGDVKILRYLITEVGMGVDLTHGASKKTALHYAAGGFKDKGAMDAAKDAKKYLQCVKFLVEEASASLWQQDAMGNTALDCAHKADNALVVDYLQGMAQGKASGDTSAGAAARLIGKEEKGAAASPGQGGGKQKAKRKSDDGGLTITTAVDVNDDKDETGSQSSGGGGWASFSSSSDEEDDDEYKEEEHPDELSCPISFVLMTNPAVASDGHTYQKEALEQHIAYASSKSREVRSPMTNEPMKDFFFENLNLRCLVHAYLERKAREKEEKIERRAERARMRELMKQEKKRECEMQQQLAAVNTKAREADSLNNRSGSEGAAATAPPVETVKLLSGVEFLESKLSFLKKKNNSSNNNNATAAATGMPGKKKEHEDAALVQRVCESTAMQLIFEEDYKQELKSQSMKEFVAELLRDDPSTKKHLQRMLEKLEAMVLMQEGGGAVAEALRGDKEPSGGGGGEKEVEMEDVSGNSGGFWSAVGYGRRKS